MAYNKLLYLFVRYNMAEFDIEQFSICPSRSNEEIAALLDENEWWQKRSERYISSWLPLDEQPSAEEMEASDEIYFANMRIAKLQAEIARQQLKIREALKRLEAKAPSETRKMRGRPARNPSAPGQETPRETATKSFLRQWVKSVQAEMGVETCSDLERLLPDTDQRNWRRWLNGAAIPTPNSFMQALHAQIMSGEHAGKCLFQMATTPPGQDLFLLLKTV